MHRGGRVAGRARFASYGVLTTKVNKSALCSGSDRAKRGALVPRTSKNRAISARHSVSTVDKLAFSSVLRGVVVNQPLFCKTGVMRYDPLKKNVVRPFRALFGFVYGLVRSVLQSALAISAAPLRLLPMAQTSFNKRNMPERKTNSQATQVAVSGRLPKARSRPTPTVESHPLRCFKRSTSEIPAASLPRHRRGRSEIIMDGSKEISEVLRTYNTSESRDRLISKLEHMKSSAAECIKSLSHRSVAEHHSRRDLLNCKQEMIHLSKKLSGIATQHSALESPLSRSQSVMERPRTALSVESFGAAGLPERYTMRPESQNAKSRGISAHTLVERAKDVAAKKAQDATSAPEATRSESLRLKLKKHEQMFDTLKSKYNVPISLPHERERRHGIA